MKYRFSGLYECPDGTIDIPVSCAIGANADPNDRFIVPLGASALACAGILDKGQHFFRLPGVVQGCHNLVEKDLIFNREPVFLKPDCEVFSFIMKIFHKSGHPSSAEGL